MSHRRLLVVAAAVGMTVGARSPAKVVETETLALPDGRTVVLPEEAQIIGEPAVSPDDRQVAYIRAVGPKPNDPDDPQPTEIIMAELPVGGAKIVISPSSSYFDLRSAVRVTYAADGRHLYVEATCPCDSDSIHEIDPVTGTHRRIA